ncbi:putative Zinc metalloproteinase nas-14 [Hypsibius exemplaris]|uniref:Metalloendopeptidase n=1 Tax=Hypsibius exemplaris TaxID=2072580 RepID=A0A1W0XDK4_HYPEX|nr:putative Zinc metalloproteinase nas-14 [Hypsibius exemplaris]
MLFILAVLVHTVAQRAGTAYANLVTDEAALWPRHTVPFEYGASLGVDEKIVLKGLFFLFHAQTCVRFTARRKEEDYLVIEMGEFRTLLPSIGKQRLGGRQVLTFLPQDFDEKRIILRDLLRTLGFYYEIERPDRFMFVNVQLKNVMTKDWSKFSLIQGDSINLLGESYDYNSASHFLPEEFAAGDEPTFTVLAPNQEVGQDDGLSEIDVRRVNKAYRCSLTINQNRLCPEKWISGEDGRCYYLSFLDPAGKATQGPARRECEKMLAMPMVMEELSIPTRGFLLDIIRRWRSDALWVTGTNPSRELRAERDSKCSILDVSNHVRSLDDDVPCDGAVRNFTCQRTAANECWYVRDGNFLTYPDCIRA